MPNVNPKSRRDVLAGVGAGLIGGLAGCTDLGGGGGNGDSDSIRAAFVVNGVIDQPGWSKVHEDARTQLDDEYDWLETAISTEVPPADAPAVFRDYANDGYDIIFGCTVSYMDPIMQVAEEFPDIYFENAAGYQRRENLSTYNVHFDHANYLAGVAAGMVSEANVLGHLSSFEIPFTARQINAITLGAQSVNEDMTTRVRFMNQWFEPSEARSITQSMIDNGIDVMSQVTDSPSPVRTANENDVWAIGFYDEFGEYGEDNYLTGILPQWGAYYDDTLQNVREETWEEHDYWGGFAEEAVRLEDWGPQVPSDVQDTVAEERDRLENGDLNIWAGTEFEGESREFLLADMASYVDGVQVQS